MKEELIEKIIFKFEKVIGPVARHLAIEVAERKKILKENKISPQDQQVYASFLTELIAEYSKITNKDLVERTFESVKENE